MSWCQRHCSNQGFLVSKVSAFPILLSRLRLPVWAQGYLTPSKARGLSGTAPAELLCTLSLPDWPHHHLASFQLPAQPGVHEGCRFKAKETKAQVRGAQCWKLIPAGTVRGGGGGLALSRSCCPGECYQWVQRAGGGGGEGGWDKGLGLRAAFAVLPPPPVLGSAQGGSWVSSTWDGRAEAQVLGRGLRKLHCVALPAEASARRSSVTSL